jgi:four helix bundle protein
VPTIGTVFAASLNARAASELEYHLLLSRDLKLIQQGDYEQLEPRITEIKRMLTVFVQKLTAES